MPTSVTSNSHRHLPWSWRTVAAITSLLALAACNVENAERQQEIVRPVQAIKVADASNFEQRWFSGRAEGTKSVDLSFRVSGSLVSRPADVGEFVNQGDIIAQVDPETFEADLARAKAGLDRAKANLTDARDKLQKRRKLVDTGLYKQTALDTFKAAVQEARANVAAQGAALKRRQLEAKYTTLKAPFAGVIVKTYVENFQDIRAKEPIARLVDNSKIELTVNIPESLISQAHLVKKTIVRFDALPNLDVPATVIEIGTEATDTTRTYPVTMVMSQPKGAKILPGMAGQAMAAPGQLTEPTSQIVVPETALLTRTDPAKTFVWVVDGESKLVTLREVQAQRVVDRGLAVSQGLKPGEWVVTAGVHFLREGQKVRLLED